MQLALGDSYGGVDWRTTGKSRFDVPISEAVFINEMAISKALQCLLRDLFFDVRAPALRRGQLLIVVTLFRLYRGCCSRATTVSVLVGSASEASAKPDRRLGPSETFRQVWRKCVSSQRHGRCENDVRSRSAQASALR